MDVIQLQPDSVINLTLLALIAPFVVYLLTLRDKDASTRWLIAYLVGTALALVAYALFVSIFWVFIVGSTDPSVPERVLVRLPHFFGLVAAWAYVQFAYAVLRDPFPKEARIVRTVSAVLVLTVGLLIGINYVSGRWLLLTNWSGKPALYGISILGTGLYVWALIVFVRKWLNTRQSTEEQVRRATEAFGVYGLLTFWAVVSVGLPSATQIGLPTPDGTRFVEPILALLFTFGLAFAFVNYTPRATSFQVKLVGLTLAAVLLVLASAIAITAESAEADLQGEPIPSGQAFRFAPDERGGYEVQPAAIGYDAERGEDLNLGYYGPARLALPFVFPFDGRMWDTVYVYPQGLITLGARIDTTEAAELGYKSSAHMHRYIHRRDAPKIAALWTRFNPSKGGDVFARAESDRHIVTWHDVPHHVGAKDYVVGREEPIYYDAYPTTNRIQLVLHASGAIDMIYDRVMLPPGRRTYGARGLVMGRDPDEPVPLEPDLGAIFRESMKVELDAQLAFTVPPGTSVLEDLYVKYRSRLHERLRPLAWLVICATLFIVLAVPYFHRWSLSKPLDRLLGGMKRVDSGDLDVEVPVGARDEIGRVTHHFNRMTASLRETEADLRDYAEHLEERVEERTAELQVEKAKTEAQSARLLELDEAKSRFFANVSHELRTPLTLLLGPIRDALAAPERGVPPHQLPAMHRSAERLLTLVDELLDLARLDAGRLRLRVAQHDLVALTRRTVLAFTSRAEREELALTFDASREQLDAWVDAERYERVVSNLLTNAFKFTPSSGWVRVTLDEDEGAAVLTVRDTGEGIRADLLPHVFERFRQGDDAATRRHEGAGIGLALVRELVELHGGRVEVQSEVGFGSAFTVWLPLGDEHFDDEALAGDLASEPPRPVVAGAFEDAALEMSDDEAGFPAVRTDASVLIVEDHDDMRAYLRALLMPHYDVEEADNGQTGLETARRLAVENRAPDLVISDVMMPGLDGYALCHALKADDALGHIPVVLLTARADVESKLEGLGEGADDYLAKPFSADELLARCENLIEVRRRLRARFSGEVVVKPTDVVVEREEATWLDDVKAICEPRLSDSNFGVDWLADELGVSARTLRRRMKAAIGLTPGAFLRTMRLERAAQLLEEGAGGVSDVAAAVGYNDPEWFSRAFRQGFGVLPSDVADQAG